jgi:hypothetical protein
MVGVGIYQAGVHVTAGCIDHVCARWGFQATLNSYDSALIDQNRAAWDGAMANSEESTVDDG